MEKKSIANIFLFALLGITLYLVYRLFAPFLMVILLSGMLVSIFYSLFERLAAGLRGHKSLAAAIMVLLIAVVIILPTIDFLFYLSKQSLDGFGAISSWISAGELERTVNDSIISRLNFIDPNVFNIRQYLISVSGKVSAFLVSGGASLLLGTGQFLTSLVLMLFTMFFMFRDGRQLVEWIMRLTPLPNRYDRAIFNKFRNVSFSTIVSTFATAIAQGLAGGIGFMVVGIPAFFPGIAMAFLSLLPYVGAAFVWFPAAIYLLIVGKIWQGVFLLVWGVAVVSVVDNILRPLLIRKKAEVHPLLIFFSIFGGIIAFGFWGMLIGPVVIAVTVTLLHIYELEYREVLER